MFNSVFKGVVASPNRGGVVFSTEYQAILTYATSQGWALPTSGQQVIQNNLMVSLVSSNIFTNLDALYILATNGSQEFSRINWISPGSNNLTASGAPAPTFDSNLGWRVTSTGTGYMDTNFKFTGTSPQKLRQTSGSAFAWIDQFANGYFLGHAGTAGANELTLRFNNQSNQNNRMMTNTNSSANINFSGNGLKAGYSTAANTQKYYSDNSPLSTQARTSQGPDTQNNVSLFRSANAYAAANQRVALFGFGGNIESSHSSLYTALNTYMTSK
jgi:hypothetical protein